MSKRDVAGLVALVGTALALTSCGGSGGSQTARDTPSAPPTRTASAPSTGAMSPGQTMTPGTGGSATRETTPTSPAEHPDEAGPRTCRTADLTAGVGHAGGAAGHLRIDIVLRNTGSSRCTLYGYPKVVPLTSKGEPLADLKVSHDGSVAVPKVKPHRVVLAPGEKASFAVGYSDVPTGDSPCPDASSMRVSPPEDSHALKVDAALNHACGPKITVSPVVRGTEGPTP